MSRFNTSYNAFTKTMTINIDQRSFSTNEDFYTPDFFIPGVPGLYWYVKMSTFQHMKPLIEPCLFIWPYLSLNGIAADAVVKVKAKGCYYNLKEVNIVAEPQQLMFFVCHAILNAHADINNHMFQFTCKLIIPNDIIRESAATMGLPYFDLYQSSMKKTPDFQINVDGQHLMAHQSYLSLISPVFFNFLKNNEESSALIEYNIEVFDYETVKLGLDYIYGIGLDDVDISAVFNVLQFVNTYKIIDAAQHIQQNIKHQIKFIVPPYDTDNVTKRKWYRFKQ